MTLAIRPQTPTAATCTPFCKDPTRRGTRQIAITSLIVQGWGASEAMGFSQKLYLTLSAGRGGRRHAD